MISRVALALVVTVAAPARARPVVEKFGDLTVDFSAGTVEAHGAGAPDLRAPSAQVARVKAERTARMNAAKRLRAALAKLPRERLGCPDPDRLPSPEKLLEKAEGRDLTWGSDGAVELTLRVSIWEMTGAMGGLAAGSAVILVGPVEKPTVVEMQGEGRSCAQIGPPPPIFETVAEAQQSLGPARAAVKVVHKLDGTMWIAAFAQRER